MGGFGENERLNSRDKELQKVNLKEKESEGVQRDDGSDRWKVRVRVGRLESGTRSGGRVYVGHGR